MEAKRLVSRLDQALEELHGRVAETVIRLVLAGRAETRPEGCRGPDPVVGLLLEHDREGRALGPSREGAEGSRAGFAKGRTRALDGRFEGINSSRVAEPAQGARGLDPEIEVSVDPPQGPGDPGIARMPPKVQEGRVGPE